MSKNLVKHERRRTTEQVDVPATKSGTNTFTSFRYASAEITLHGGKAHVRARRTQWEDGTLSSEAFEGEVDQRVYDQAILQAQRYVIGQTALVLQSLTSLLTFGGRRSRDGD
jgi:hypothetical protein